MPKLSSVPIESAPEVEEKFRRRVQCIEAGIDARALDMPPTPLPR